MQRLDVGGAVRPLYGSLGVKVLKTSRDFCPKVAHLDSIYVVY